MKVLFNLFATLTLSASVAAATSTDLTSQSTSTISKYWESLRESPFSLTYLNETIVSSYGGKGLLSDHFFYFGYKIDKKHSIKIVPVLNTDFSESRGSDGQLSGQKSQSQAHTEYQYTQVRFYKNGILNQEDHGINLNFQLRNYIYNDNSRSAGIDTKHRFYFLPSVAFGKFSVYGAAFREFYTGGTTKKSNDYIALTPTYQINDNWYVASVLEYYSTNYEDTTNDKEYIYITPLEIGWSKRNLSVAVYGNFMVASSKDRFDGFVNKWWKSGEIYTDISYSLF